MVFRKPLVGAFSFHFDSRFENKRLCLDFDGVIELDANLIYTSFNSINFEIEAKWIYKVFLKHVPLRQRLIRLFINHTEAFPRCDNFSFIEEEVVISLVFHSDSEGVGASVAHVNRIKIVKRPRIDLQVPFLDIFRVYAPSLKSLGLELGTREEHFGLSDLLQNHFVAILCIVFHHIDNRNVS